MAREQFGLSGDLRSDSASVLVAVQDLRREEREKSQKDTDFAKTVGRTVRRHYIEQTNARYRAAAETDTPFHERLVHFWSNHFAISADKQPIPAVAGLYEKEAIRPNVTGKFMYIGNKHRLLFIISSKLPGS